MKKLLYPVIALIVLATSCKTMPKYTYVSNSAGPYVQLKTGEKFTGTSAEHTSGLFVKDKITLGDTAFRSKDVAFYSPGDFNYANVGKKTFAAQVATGKINMYQYVTVSTTTSSNGSGGFSTSSSKHVYNYIQKGDGQPVQTLTYNHLLPMVAPRTPEFKMLERYRKQRVTSRILGYGSLGLLAGGVALISSGNTTTGSIGLGALGCFFPAAISYIVVSGLNHTRLAKAVLLADHKRGEKKHHQRER